jgi:hypothetical protein
MNRCTALHHSPQRRLALLAAFVSLGLLTAPWASAQNAPRQFPPAAKRGFLEITAPPEALLNGTADRLSPGARIRGANNMLVMSGALVGQRLVVNYTRTPQGQIHDVWILSDAEALEERAGSEPITNFVFGSDADKPKTDDGKTPFDQLPKYPKQ